VPSASQIKKDARALDGALLSACQSDVGTRILIENRDKQDGIHSWCQLLQQYRGLVKWIQDYGDAFTELALLGQKTWNDDEIKKRWFVQNAQDIGLVDTAFEELVSDKSFIETRNLQFP
jgi:hypothetical protein